MTWERGLVPWKQSREPEEPRQANLRLQQTRMRAPLTRQPFAPGAGRGHFQIRLRPKPRLRSEWTLRDGAAEFSWSTGFSGLSFRLRSNGAALTASAVPFADVHGQQLADAFAVRVTQIECGAEERTTPDASSQRTPMPSSRLFQLRGSPLNSISLRGR